MISAQFARVNKMRLNKLCIFISLLFTVAYSQDTSVALKKPVRTWDDQVKLWIAEYIGKPAPDFGFTTTSGDQHRLSEFHSKLVFLEFWGSWCHACLEDLPNIKKAYQAYQSRDVVFISIDNDVKNKWTLDSLRAFNQKSGMTWMQVLDDKNPSICDLYRIKFYPSLFLIRSGKILACGFLFDQIRSTLDNEIKKQ